jgi:hypothetical protein
MKQNISSFLFSIDGFYLFHTIYIYIYIYILNTNHKIKHKILECEITGSINLHNFYLNNENVSLTWKFFTHKNPTNEAAHLIPPQFRMPSRPIING